MGARTPEPISPDVERTVKTPGSVESSPSPDSGPESLAVTLFDPGGTNTWTSFTPGVNRTSRASSWCRIRPAIEQTVENNDLESRLCAIASRRSFNARTRSNLDPVSSTAGVIGRCGELPPPVARQIERRGSIVPQNLCPWDHVVPAGTLDRRYQALIVRVHLSRFQRVISETRVYGALLAPRGGMRVLIRRIPAFIFLTAIGAALPLVQACGGSRSSARTTSAPDCFGHRPQA